MTTANMLAQVRTLLDEASAGFWSDTEIYRSLNNGQRMTAARLHLKKSPLIDDLRVELSKSDSSGWLNLPSDYWQIESIKYANTNSVNKAPCLVRTGNIYAKEANTYLGGTATQPFVYIEEGLLRFDPAPGSDASYTMLYYAHPQDLATNEPDLPEITHPAIIQYAFADLLLKDEKHGQSTSEYNKYNDMVNML